MIKEKLTKEKEKRKLFYIGVNSASNPHSHRSRTCRKVIVKILSNYLQNCPISVSKLSKEEKEKKNEKKWFDLIFLQKEKRKQKKRDLRFDLVKLQPLLYRLYIPPLFSENTHNDCNCYFHLI